MFEDDFPFPKVGYVSSLEGTCFGKSDITKKRCPNWNVYNDCCSCRYMGVKIIKVSQLEGPPILVVCYCKFEQINSLETKQWQDELRYER